MEFRSLQDFSLYSKHSASVILFNPPTSKTKKYNDAICLFSFSTEVKGWGAGRSDEGFFVNSAGEYEFQSTTIRGYGSEISYCGTTIQTTSYLVDNGDFQIFFLGPIKTKSTSEEISKQVAYADIVAVPVDKECISFADATQFASNVSAKLLLPYGNNLSANEHITKEAGMVETAEKYVVKRQELTSDTLKTVILV